MELLPQRGAPIERELYRIIERSKRLSLPVESFLAGDPHLAIDAIHLHAVSGEQARWVLGRAKHLLERLKATFIVMNGDVAPTKTLIEAHRGIGKDEPDVGSGLWSGYAEWTNTLLKQGIPGNQILPAGPGAHTHQEVDNIIRCARENKWQRVVTITSLPQVVRMALTFYGGLKRNDILDPSRDGATSFLFLGVPSASEIDLTEVIHGTTGDAQVSVRQHFLNEAEKIRQYRQKYPEQIGTDDWLEHYIADSLKTFKPNI